MLGKDKIFQLERKFGLEGIDISGLKKRFFLENRMFKMHFYSSVQKRVFIDAVSVIVNFQSH